MQEILELPISEELKSQVTVEREFLGISISPKSSLRKMTKILLLMKLRSPYILQSLKSPDLT